MPLTTRALRALALAGLALVARRGAAAQERHQDPLHAGLEAPGHPRLVFLGAGQGLFRRRKLDVTIDQGEGSAATVTRIMSGAYDAGFGDINAIIQNAATKPGEAPRDGLHDLQQGAVRAADQGREPDQDIQGHRGQEARRARRRRAAQAASARSPRRTASTTRARCDALNMAPNLQEQMLLQGQVDVIAIFTATSYMNLVALKLDPDKDFRWIYYSDAALDLYSNGVMVVAEACQGEARGGQGAGARDQQGDARGHGRSRRCDRAAGRKRSRSSTRTSRSSGSPT